MAMPRSIKPRLPQFLLIGTFLPFCWLAMQAVHEAGHVLLAHLTGGQVLHVALHPLILSRTDLGYNPHPLAVVWAGPLLGSLLPLLLFLLAAALRLPGVYLLRFFAGFCLIANGGYIGAGHWLADESDPHIMTQYGTPLSLLLLFALLASPLGLYLWHRQGPYFGLGKARHPVPLTAALTSTGLLLAITTTEFLCNSR